MRRHCLQVNVVFTLAPEGGKSSRAADEGALALDSGGERPSNAARPLSGQPRIVVGGGPAAYRALLQAEFEEKSERVLAVLQAKDASVVKLEASLVGCRADLAASRAREAEDAAELEVTRAKLAVATTQSDDLAAELSQALNQYPASPYTATGPQSYVPTSQARPLPPPPVPGTAGAAFAAGAAAGEASGAALLAEQSVQVEMLEAELTRLQAELAQASKSRADEGFQTQTQAQVPGGGGDQGEGPDAQDFMQRRVDGTREERVRGVGEGG